MARFEIRPLAGWDKPRTGYPRRATFRAGWEETLDLLKAEVIVLDGDVIACQIDIAEAQVRRDGMLRSTARVSGFQGVKVSFDSRYGPLTYATDTFDFWKDNVRAIALGLQALRAVDRYGITKSGEQYRGWNAISATPVEDTLTPESARLVFADALRVRQEMIDVELSTREGIAKTYRLAAKLHHPDVGGSESVMRLITKARDVLLAVAR